MFKSSAFILSHLHLRRVGLQRRNEDMSVVAAGEAGAAVPVSWNVNIMISSKNTDSCLAKLWRRAFEFVQLRVSTVFAAGQLTISVSDTGPKLVTKIFVLISVTFSVERGSGWDHKRSWKAVNFNWTDIRQIHGYFLNMNQIWDDLSWPRPLKTSAQTDIKMTLSTMYTNCSVVSSDTINYIMSFAWSIGRFLYFLQE